MFLTLLLRTGTTRKKSFLDQYPSVKINLNEEKTREAVPRRCAVEVPEVCNFIKKETLAVFSCEFCEIFKNIFFTKHLRTTASEE